MDHLTILYSMDSFLTLFTNNKGLWRLLWDKHSSLFYSFINDEEKKVLWRRLQDGNLQVSLQPPHSGEKKVFCETFCDWSLLIGHLFAQFAIF